MVVVSAQQIDDRMRIGAGRPRDFDAASTTVITLELTHCAVGVQWAHASKRVCATTAIRSDDRTRHTLCTRMGSGRK